MADIGIPVVPGDMSMFSVPPINVIQKKITKVKFEPVYGQGGSFHFNIPGTGIEYTDLSNAELSFELHIKDSHGNVILPTDARSAIPIDNVLHSMFSMIEVYGNGVLMSTTGTNYPYKAYIENMLTYSKENIDTHLTLQGFTGDAGNFDQTSLKTKKTISAGLLARSKWWKQVETIYRHNDPAKPKPEDPSYDDAEDFDVPTFVEFRGPLLLDLFNQPRPMPNSLNIDIKLFPTRDAFKLLCNPTTLQATCKLENVCLWVPKIELEPEAQNAIDTILTKTPLLYPFMRTEMRTVSIPAGTFSKTFEDLFQGEVPTRMLVGMVDGDAYNGNYGLNPLRFKHFNVASMGFYVNGEPTPREPYELNFTEGQYLDGLKSLYDVAGKSFENTNIPINRDQYRQGFALIGFEVDPTTSANFDYLGKYKAGRTRLAVRFHKALKKTTTLIVYATFPEVMQIDKARIPCLREKEKTISRLQNAPYLCAPTIAPSVPN